MGEAMSVLIISPFIWLALILIAASYKQGKKEVEYNRKKDAINFAKWLNANGWVTRFYPEEDGEFLYDDNDNDLTPNPKTLEQLYIYYKLDL